MDKNVIKENKEAFDYWLNGGKIWERFTGNFLNWKISEPRWNAGLYLYVQDDEYAEFRKAQADGKTLEVWVTDGWCENERPMNFTEPIKYYRIKPDEPKYSREDWLDKFVIDTKTKTIHKIVSICPKQNELAICVVDDIYKRLRVLKSDDLDKFIPKPDESKFKEGDWVKYKNNGSPFRYEEYHIYEPFTSKIELWIPKIGNTIICLYTPTPRILKVSTENMAFVNQEFKKKRILPYVGQPLKEMKR